MSKSLSEAAITRAIQNSVVLAKTGTPEQRAGMFKPVPPAKPGQTAKARTS